MKNKKSLIISLSVITGIIAVVAVIIIIAIIGCFIFYSYIFGGFPYEKIETSISNYGKNEIVIWQNQGRGFFGPSDVIIKANNNNFFSRYVNIHIYKTEIYDDGGKGNINISWDDSNTADIRLDGCEMEYETIIKIKFDGNNIKFINESIY